MNALGMPVQQVPGHEGTRRPRSYRPTSRRNVAAVIVGLILATSLVGCHGGNSASAKISYTPPFLPFTISIDTDGHISISGSHEVLTQYGTFSIGADASRSLSSVPHATLLIIRHKSGAAIVDDVFKVRSQEIVTVVDGRVTLTVADGRVFVDASKGNVRSIGVRSTADPSTALPAPVTAARTTPPPAKVVPPPSSTVTGAWEGTYECAQGETGLRLILRPSGDGALIGTFNFYPLPSNPVAATGSFTMRGSYSGSGLTLIHQQWISQPDGYHMVDLQSGPLSADGTLAGSVSTDGCSAFSLHRAAPTPPPSTLSGEWRGTYTCAQGETGLRLVLTANTDGSLSGTFNFYPLASNPGAASGTFTMRGFYSGTGVHLIHDQWINQPDGYEMVDLQSGPPSADGTLAGSVTTGGCGAFSLHRS